jgi:predicted peptidase
MNVWRHLLLGWGVLVATLVHAQFSIHDVFVRESITNRQGERLPARVWRNYTPEDLPVPVLVMLHGSGECGTDNAKQLAPFKALHRQLLLLDDTPVLVILPQCTMQNPWVRKLAFTADYKQPRYAAPALRTVKEHLEMLVSQGIADPKRLYLGGYSLGAFGTWDAIQRWPETFAAAIPICGGGSLEEKAIEHATKTSLWVFHGAADMNVKVDCSRRLVRALGDAGAYPHYTEYPTAGHAIWDQALGDLRLYEWLFDQRLGTVTTATDPEAPTTKVRTFLGLF